jgi:membrane protease YdiL (CAAX protease family)
MTTNTDRLQIRPDPQKFALIALGVYVVSEIAVVLEVLLSRGETGLLSLIPIMGKWLIFNWMVPILVVLVIERQDFKSLGLWLPKDKRFRYIVIAFTVVLLPGILIGFDGELAGEFLEQIIYIGLAEEFFYRGYLLIRLCNWLGKNQGLVLTSFLFGLGHVTFRVIYFGLEAFIPAFTAGAQAFIGGLLFGYIFLRVKNIWPGAILHISTNMYLSRLIALFIA